MRHAQQLLKQLQVAGGGKGTLVIEWAQGLGYKAAEDVAQELNRASVVRRASAAEEVRAELPSQEDLEEDAAKVMSSEIYEYLRRNESG